MFKFIWIKGERYYYNGTYKEFLLALKVAKKEKKKTKKCKYFITKNLNGMYDLWMNKKIMLW